MKKKVMICVDMSKESQEAIENGLKCLNWDEYEQIYYVNGFERVVFVDTFYLATHPMDSNFAEIEKSVKENLQALDERIRPGQAPQKASYHSFLSSFPKDALCDFAKENKIDEMVIATRGRSGIQGLFSSSFAEHMVRHAPCALRILRV